MVKNKLVNSIIGTRFSVIKLVCPRCGFAIEVFSEDDLNEPRKKKRYEALLKRQTLCVNCNTMILRLKEVRE